VESTTRTVFEIVGGQPFFDALIERFYDRVEHDPVLRPVYPADLEPGKRALAMFLAQYWGGPPDYSAEKGHPRLRMRHAPFSIGVSQRDAWVDAMLAALDETDAPGAAKAAMRAYFETAATAMINRGATMQT
jgi:hemoglobin